MNVLKKYLLLQQQTITVLVYFQNIDLEMMRTKS